MASTLIAEGGRLWVERDKDSGTRAIFTLPSIEGVPTADMEDTWSWSSPRGGDILLATRSPILSDDDALRNILADLGFQLLHSRYEYELDRIMGPEPIKAVMTSSPSLVDVIRNVPHFKDKPIILLLKQNSVTRINVRWCMDRHVCAVLCYPLSHENTSEALRKALTWHPASFSLPDPSPPLNILVAEDNFVNQKVTTKLLERLYHKVEVVENGLFAVDAVADRWYRQRPYDLILMDSHMPVMNGYDAICEIRQFEEDNGFSPTPTVLLSLGMDMPYTNWAARNWARAFDEGFVGVLTKPIKKSELAQILLKHSRTRRSGDDGDSK
ncbi:histidine kinase osmosensor [Tulasnella sp. 425]|nr:histidine kinase osmosensor [Tulasnella sp. 425]